MANSQGHIQGSEFGQHPEAPKTPYHGDQMHPSQEEVPMPRIEWPCSPLQPQAQSGAGFDLSPGLTSWSTVNENVDSTYGQITYSEADFRTPPPMFPVMCSSGHLSECQRCRQTQDLADSQQYAAPETPSGLIDRPISPKYGQHASAAGLESSPSFIVEASPLVRNVSESSLQVGSPSFTGTFNAFPSQNPIYRQPERLGNVEGVNESSRLEVPHPWEASSAKPPGPRGPSVTHSQLHNPVLGLPISRFPQMTPPNPTKNGSNDRMDRTGFPLTPRQPPEFLDYLHPPAGHPYYTEGRSGHGKPNGSAGSPPTSFPVDGQSSGGTSRRKISDVSGGSSDPANVEGAKKRTRRTFTDMEKADMKHKRGKVCPNCKSRKLKCLHVLEGDHESIPPTPSTAPDGHGSQHEHPFNDRSIGQPRRQGSTGSRSPESGVHERMTFRQQYAPIAPAPDRRPSAPTGPSSAQVFSENSSPGSPVLDSFFMLTSPDEPLAEVGSHAGRSQACDGTDELGSELRKMFEATSERG